MSEYTPAEEAATPAAEPAPVPIAEPELSTADLAASIRRLRIWLIVLTVAVVLAVLGACGACSASTLMLAPFPFFDIWNDPYALSDEQLDETRDEFEDALGDRLESLEVRAVRIDYGYAEFPYSLMPDGGEEAIYVEYRLQGSRVVVADILGGPFGPDVSSSGMIPTRGSLTSRMSEEQFERILAAYARETKAPLGSVRRYDDPGPMAMYDYPSKDEVLVGGTEYAAKELWSATEGMQVEGDRIDMTRMMSSSRKAHVFHEDPETGEFTYLGAESAEVWW